MEKILMVCLGNICRSPLAEGILKQKLKDKGIDAFVDSAGTSDWHAGECPDARAIAKAKEYGVNIDELQARQITASDFNQFDRIYVMDGNNLQEVMKLTKNDEHKMKVKLLLNEIYPEQNLAVPDPYFGGEEGFEKVYSMLNKACNKIVDDLKKK